MSVDGEEAAMGDLGEVQQQPVDVNNADEGSGGDDGDLGMKGGSGEPQNNDGEDGKILDRDEAEGQYNDYTNEEDDSPANDETHNSDQASSTGRAQLTGGKCYSF